MDIDNWINTHSSEITLFGEKGVEVVLASDVKLLIEDLLEECKPLERVIGEDGDVVKYSQIVGEGGCKEFYLEDGMFAYLPNSLVSQELLDTLKGTWKYEVEHYLLDCYECDGSCSEWSIIRFTEGYLEVDYEPPNNQIEISYEGFLNCL